MAHEINNPLEGMANYLSLAREDLAQGDASAARGRLDRVQEGIDRVAGIVRQVLAHADPAAAPQSPVEVRSVLEQTVEFVRSRGEFGGIDFGLDVDESPLVVRGSPVMLGQVALNLVLNACEAQPAGGEVKVRAWRENGEVRVEFADRGPGVPADAGARIFEPFYSTKQSTGLGLSICHSIVLRHQGELTVRDRPGGGALFTLRLPSAEARA
jgi:two-component system C4-dicarboxylate transport sensor histidine kinase DctB